MYSYCTCEPSVHYNLNHHLVSRRHSNNTRVRILYQRFSTQAPHFGLDNSCCGGCPVVLQMFSFLLLGCNDNPNCLHILPNISSGTQHSLLATTMPSKVRKFPTEKIHENNFEIFKCCTTRSHDADSESVDPE